MDLQQNNTCLIIDEMHESIIPMLEAAGFKPDYRPQIDREGIIQVISGYSGLIVRSKTYIDKEIIQAADKLLFVARAGAGIDKLDMGALEKKHIKVINAPEGNRDALAEHAMGMLLCLFNKIHMADREVRGGIWNREKNRGVEIMGKSIGIIGYGNMGQAFAMRLKSFGCKILAYDKYKKRFADQYVEEAQLDQLYRESDIISLHVPLTKETKAFINDDFINKFQKNIYLLNTARGEILSLKALINGIKSGKISGAALDVLENEKIDHLSSSEIDDFDFLIQSERVLLTPHVAGWTKESYLKINQVLVDKIKSIFLA